MANDGFEAGWSRLLAQWGRACDEDAELAALRAGADLCFALDADGHAATLALAPAAPARVSAGVDAAATLVLRASRAIWSKFLAPMPEPFYHHFYAMRMRVPGFEIAGDEAALARSAHLLRRALELARWTFNGRDAAALRPRAPQPPAPGTLEPITGRYVWVELDGRANRIYWETSGSGHDLLCLHTAGSDGRQFRALMNDAELRAAWRMVSFDLPWHGKSLPPQGAHPGSWRLDTARYAAAIEAMIEALGLRRPVLLGSSMGGHICLEMALRLGERLGGVIACEAAETIRGRQAPWARHPEVNQATFVPEWVHGLMAPNSPAECATDVWWEYSQGGYGVFHGDLAFYSGDWDASDRVHRIDTAKCPVIMLTGEYDYSCTPGLSRATAARIPGARFEVMRGMGHFPMTENPEGFMTYLRPALATLRARLS